MQKTVTSSDLDAYLAGGGGPVLVHATADWSAPARAMRPHFAKAAAELGRKVRLVTVHVSDALSADRLGVTAVPALVLFQAGRPVRRWTGAIDAKGIIDWTRQALAAADPAAG